MEQVGERVALGHQALLLASVICLQCWADVYVRHSRRHVCFTAPGFVNEAMVKMVPPYLVFALHPTHSNVILVGLPGPFLEGRAVFKVGSVRARDSFVSVLTLL